MKLEYTQEELDLLDSIEKGEWKSIENLEEEKKRFQEYAANTLRKDKRVNIRMLSLIAFLTPSFSVC